MLQFKLPIYHSFLIGKGVTSPINSFNEEGRAVKLLSGAWVKLFSLQSMIKNQSKQLPMLNEFAVADLSETLKLHHIIPMSGLFRGWDHVGIKYPVYDMCLEQYLEERRDRSQLPHIMEQVCNGVMELHALGYTHRALEPSHVVLNLAPLEVRLISFSGAVPCSQSSKRNAKIAPLQMPFLRKLQDGA